MGRAAGKPTSENYMIHVGKMIKAEFDKHPKSHTVVWFAEQLSCGRNNIYDIFSRKAIDTDLLVRISHILQHDFFLDISCEMARAGLTDTAGNGSQ